MRDKPNRAALQCVMTGRKGRRGAANGEGEDQEDGSATHSTCDAENAGDAVDVLRAGALLVGVVRDSASDPSTSAASAAARHWSATKARPPLRWPTASTTRA